MKEKYVLYLVFIVSTILLFLNMIFVIVNFSILFDNYLFLLISAIFTIVIVFMYMSLKRIIIEYNYDIKEKKQKEKNVKDCYRYHTLMNPPEYNN